MCAQKWAEINFTKAPSLCLDCQKRFFVNEGKDRARDNLDRLEHLACREHLLEMIAENFEDVKSQGGYIRRSVGVVLNSKPRKLSDAVCAILKVQWEAVRNGLLGIFEARKVEQAQASQSTRPCRGAIRERRHATSQTPAPTSFILSGEMEECIRTR
jgi:hypothetical protein